MSRLLLLTLLASAAVVVHGAVSPCAVTTLAGPIGTNPYTTTDGAGTNARLNQPAQLALDPSGVAFFFAAQAEQRLRRVTTAGMVTSHSGGVQGFADGVGSNALYTSP